VLCLVADCNHHVGPANHALLAACRYTHDFTGARATAWAESAADASKPAALCLFLSVPSFASPPPWVEEVPGRSLMAAHHASQRFGRAGDGLPALEIGGAR
jgi:hypothetical protein